MTAEEDAAPKGQPVTALAFDLGNVLIPWEPRWLYRRILQSEAEVEWFLAEVCHHDWQLEVDRGWPLEEALAEALGRHPGAEAAILAWRARWAEMLGEPDPAMVGLLERLKAADWPLFALSNWSAETFPLAEARYPFLALFDDLVISGREGVVKPESEIYRRLIARAGRPADQILFIDDRDYNVQAALSEGLRAHHFQGFAPLAAELAGLGVLGPEAAS